MEERNYTVYKHTSPNGKVYIGITRQKPENRWKCGLGYRENKRFTNAIKKYGWSNFLHEILFENLTEKEAKNKEIELIAFYKSNQREFGYNITAGGDNVVEMRDETREKLRIANIGKKMSEESRKKMSVAHKGEKAYWYGKRLPEKVIKKISESRKGKISWMCGKKHAEDSIKKMSEAKKGKTPWNKGKKGVFKHSEEWKKQASKRSKKTNEPRQKKVICVETNQIYNSINETKKYGFSPANVCYCCKGLRETTGGYHWKYHE